MPQIMKGDVDGFLQNRVGEQIGAVPVPQIWEPIGEVVQLSPQERAQNCTPEQISGVPVPQIMEAVVEVFPQECVQSRLPEQIMDFPVPQNMEDVVGVVRATPQMVLTLQLDVPVPQIAEDIVEWSVTRERIIQPTLWAVYLLGLLGSLSSSWVVSEAPAKGLRGGRGGGGGDLGFELIFDGYVAEIRCEGSRAWHPLDPSWVPLPVPGPGKIYWEHGVRGLAPPDPLRGVPAPQIMEKLKVIQHVPSAVEQIVVYQCHRSCGNVEVIRGTMSLLCRSSFWSRGRCLRFSSSPEFVDLPGCNETVGLQRGFGGDVGVGIFRAPPVVWS